MNNIDLQLTLKNCSNCIDNIYYIFFIKINNLGNIDIQERKIEYDINTGYIINGDNNNILLIINNNNNPIKEDILLFLYKTLINFEYANNLRNFIINILPLIL